jgi:hypothetical protein
MFYSIAPEARARLNAVLILSVSKISKYLRFIPYSPGYLTIDVLGTFLFSYSLQKLIDSSTYRVK